MGNPTYLIILLALVMFSYFAKKRFKLKLFRNTTQAVSYFGLIFTSGLLWDYFSVGQGIWIFPEEGTIGVRLGILPVEEYLFFLVAAYFGLVIYKLLDKLLK